MAKVKKPKIDKKYDPLNNRNFKSGDNVSDNLANNHFQYVEIYHVPSKYFVTFKAYITNFSDSISAEWNSKSVYGRMDPISTYERTGRKINLGFDVVASSFEEAYNNMKRVSLLSKMFYPSIETNAEFGTTGLGEDINLSTIKTGPLFKIKFMNWIQNSYGGGEEVSAEDSGLLGWSSGFDFAPDLNMGSFQAGTDVYPKNFSISLDFSVIHEHQLGWDHTDELSGLLGGDGIFLSNPNKQFERFPYGAPGTSAEKPKKNQLSKEQANRLKDLSAAKKKLIGG
jgi:hypothetical protein